MSEGIVPRPVKNEEDQVIDLEDAHQVSHSNSSSQVFRCEQSSDRFRSPMSPLPMSNRTQRTHAVSNGTRRSNAVSKENS